MAAVASNLCQFCHSRPKNVQNGITHPYCGKKCAQAATQNGTAKQSASGQPAGLCQACSLKPRFVENGKEHPFCGKACAAKAKEGGGPSRVQSANRGGAGGDGFGARNSTGGNRANNPTGSGHSPGLCQTCGLKPKFVQNGKEYSFCGRACAAKAAPGVGSGPAQSANSGVGATCSIPGCSKPVWVDPQTRTPSKWCGAKHRNSALACLWCRHSVKNIGSFCSESCSDAADGRAPTILEIPEAHVAFQSVVEQFNKSWRHKIKPLPAVQRVYKVVIGRNLLQQYESYRAGVEARGHFTKLQPPRTEGNENRRWHGTRRDCELGANGQTQLCSHASCSLCNILRTSFDLAYFKTHTSYGRFGAGIYTSSTSSKANDYVRSPSGTTFKAMLLNKVVVGKGYKMKKEKRKLTGPPNGYDSILGEVSKDLNYDELVIYSNDAIRPIYLVLYDP